MALQDVQRLELIAGVALQASSPFAECGFASLQLEDGGEAFGYLNPDDPTDIKHFARQWLDPHRVLTRDDYSDLYDHLSRSLSTAKSKSHLLFNAKGARFLGVLGDPNRDNRLNIKVGTTSFFSYVATNFRRECGELDWLAETHPKALERSWRANLLGVHCLIYNDEGFFLVRRGHTPLFPGATSSSANGGVTAINALGKFDAVQSVINEVQHECGITISPDRIEWLGAGIAKTYFQPAIYCSAHTDQSTQQIWAALARARDKFEIGRISRGRVSVPDVEWTWLRSGADFKQLSIWSWSIPVPTRIRISRLESRILTILSSSSVHAHTKMLVILFSRRYLNSVSFGRLVSRIE